MIARELEAAGDYLHDDVIAVVVMITSLYNMMSSAFGVPSVHSCGRCHVALADCW